MAAAISREMATTLQEKVWYGRLPVVFTLSASDVTTLHAPRPYYVRVCLDELRIVKCFW